MCSDQPPADFERSDGIGDWSDTHVSDVDQRASSGIWAFYTSSQSMFHGT